MDKELPVTNPNARWYNRATYRALKYLIWGVFKFWNRITIEGQENIPEGACVLGAEPSELHRHATAIMRPKAASVSWVKSRFGTTPSLLGFLPLSDVSRSAEEAPIEPLL